MAETIKRNWFTFLSPVLASLLTLGIYSVRTAGAYDARLTALEKQQAQTATAQTAIYEKLAEINVNLERLRAEQRILHRGQLQGLGIEK